MSDEIKNEILAEGQELKEDAKNFKNEMNEDFQELKEDIKEEFLVKKEDFKEEVQKLKSEIQEEVQEFKEDVKEEISEKKEKFAKKMIKKNKKEANGLLKDQDKMDAFLEKLEKKLALVPMIGEKLVDIPVLISMVHSYIKKEYLEVPIASIVAVVSALIYFVSPVDAIADAIPVIGYLDDLAVLSWVLKMAHEDLNDYRIWKEKK